MWTHSDEWGMIEFISSVICCQSFVYLYIAMTVAAKQEPITFSSSNIQFVFGDLYLLLITSIIFFLNLPSFSRFLPQVILISNFSFDWIRVTCTDAECNTFHIAFIELYRYSKLNIRIVAINHYNSTFRLWIFETKPPLNINVRILEHKFMSNTSFHSITNLYFLSYHFLFSAFEIWFRASKM